LIDAASNIQGKSEREREREREREKTNVFLLRNK
jgi:hypothetical protein